MYMNTQAPTRRFVATIYGASGTGKTTMATTAPKPVVLLCEPQGWESIRDAARGRAPVPTFAITSIAELRQAMHILSSSKEPLLDLVKAFVKDEAERATAVNALPYTMPETVVLDSASEALRLVVEGIEGEAVAKVGSDGLPVRSDRVWAAIGDRGERLLRALRDLTHRGFHVLLLAQLEDAEKGKEEDKRRVCGPVAPMQKLQRGFAYVSNIVGMTQRQRTMKPGKTPEDAPIEQISWTVRFVGPDWMMLKSMGALRPIETQNFSAWLKRIAKNDNSNDSNDSNDSKETVT